MKLFVCSFLLPAIFFAQTNLGFDTINFTYTNSVHDSTEMTKSARFVSAVLWVSETFNSYDNVVSYQDKEEGLIIGKGNVRVDPTCTICGASGIHETQAGWVSFTFKIEVFDDSYKYEFYKFSHKADHSGGLLKNTKPDCGGMVMTKKAWGTIKEQVQKKMDLTVRSFIQSMEGE